MLLGSRAGKRACKGRVGKRGERRRRPCRWLRAEGVGDGGGRGMGRVIEGTSRGREGEQCREAGGPRTANGKGVGVRGWDLRRVAREQRSGPRVSAFAFLQYESLRARFIADNPWGRAQIRWCCAAHRPKGWHGGGARLLAEEPILGHRICRDLYVLQVLPDIQSFSRPDDKSD